MRFYGLFVPIILACGALASPPPTLAADRIGVLGSSFLMPAGIPGDEEAFFAGVDEFARLRGIDTPRIAAAGNGGSIAALCQKAGVGPKLRARLGPGADQPSAAILSRPLADGERLFCSQRARLGAFPVGIDPARAKMTFPSVAPDEKQRSDAVLIVRFDAPFFEADRAFLTFLLSDDVIGPGGYAARRGLEPLAPAARSELCKRFLRESRE